jgi:hypothetical protein
MMRMVGGRLLAKCIGAPAACRDPTALAHSVVLGRA